MDNRFSLRRFLRIRGMGPALTAFAGLIVILAQTALVAAVSAEMIERRINI